MQGPAGQRRVSASPVSGDGRIRSLLLSAEVAGAEEDLTLGNWRPHYHPKEAWEAGSDRGPSWHHLSTWIKPVLKQVLPRFPLYEIKKTPILA